MEDHSAAGHVQRALIAAARDQAREMHLKLSPADGEELAAESGTRQKTFLSKSNGIPCDAFVGYRIISELHRGGQGVVYQAIQISTQRTVAIKVMKEGPFASRIQKARFDREIRILGQIHHPNIVTIHGTGIGAGHHFFVMDFVDGDPLDAYLAPAQRSINEIIGLFAQISEAVGVAHLRGIIHRDLKPTNIRIDRQGEPRILDFGLAKSDDDADEISVTVSGQFIGSLPWASPEQAEGAMSAVDQRTDVYSIGVMLFQVLTGRFPYDVTGSLRVVLDRIINAEPVRPRTLRKEIDDDVETIILKCLDKRPVRRYQSAADLARDLRNYLSGNPIDVKRDSSLYVLRKQLRKHRLIVGVVGLMLLLITSALLVSTAGWRQAASQRDDAMEARAEAEAVTEFLTNTLGAGNPYLPGNANVTVAEALEQASTKLDDSFPDRPLLRAAIHDSIAWAYASVRMPAKGRVHSEASLRLRQSMLPADDVNLARSLLVHGAILGHLEEFEAAESFVQQALDIRQHHLGPRHTKVAECYHKLGHFQYLRGRLKEAESALRNAVDQATEFSGSESEEVSNAQHLLAVVLFEQGQYEEGKRIIESVIARRKRTLGESHPLIAWHLSVLGASLTASGRPEEAIGPLQTALEIRQSVFKEESAEIANSLNDICIVLVSLERYSEAEPVCLKNLEVRRKVYGEQSITMTHGLTALGRLYVRWSRAQDCEAPLREAVEILVASQPDHWRTAFANGLLGSCLVEQGRFEEAESLLVESYPRVRAAKGNRGQAIAEIREYLIELYRAVGRIDKLNELEQL